MNRRDAEHTGKKKTHHVDEIARAIDDGSAVIVVGAGVSVMATLHPDGSIESNATWTGLLRHGVEFCEQNVADLPDGWAKRTLEEIDSGDLGELLAAAEKISGKLGCPNGGEYARWLLETVGQLEVTRPNINKALDNLRDHHGKKIPLITTNYDTLIEDVTHRKSITWKDRAALDSVFRGDDESIVHIHGVWNRPDTVILGIRSYEDVIRDTHMQAMLRSLPASRVIIFVGFGAGLADPNFGALLKWQANVFSGSPYHHFRLAKNEEVKNLRKQHPAEQRIVVVDYGEEYDDLEKNCVNSRKTGRASRTPRMKKLKKSRPPTCRQSRPVSAAERKPKSWSAP